MTDAPDELMLARDMIEVHGMQAATVVRGKARATALAAQIPQAKSWIRVLGIMLIISADLAHNYIETFGI